MTICFKAIGSVRTETDAENIPRHFSVSQVEGWLDLHPEYLAGLSDIEPGQKIVVLFHFDRSPDFDPSLLRQTPPHADRPRGVFSICSPRRPNPIGMSVVEVLDVDGPCIHVKGLDAYDGTPILDIKPYTPPEAGGRH